MNVKVTSLMLATLMACTLIQPTQAVQPVATQTVVEQVGSAEELKQVISAEATAAREAAENIQHPQGIGLYLDSTALLDVEREMYQGQCYVSVEDFLAQAQPQAVVSQVEGGISISASTGTETLEMSVYDGASYVVANDRYLYVPNGVVNLDGELAIPVNTMAKILNLELVRDDQTGYIRLYTQEGQAYLTWGSAYYNSNDFYWLSRIIYAESGNQPMAGKIAVGNVVMNRVASYKFPNTVKGVIFQTNQFSPAASGSIYRDPNWDSQVAAKLVLDGAVVLDNALFFNVAGLNSYASRNRAYVATIGAHAFYA
ncbi:cell wall hydrolase [Pseudoflavonifractor sp. An85]|uniref:cell wall hydrolase n=1 Tax=Pseudoflavonifractor sp. An85 TaxID=1965661 RepID=UPI000B3659A3|nr:cell wall hydrolase [Pseudoflavonifractor sp. An85]OUN26047.1 hypothetical protein B5G37_02125 [Pseudoflavonifractor sp. An85]